MSLFAYMTDVIGRTRQHKFDDPRFTDDHEKFVRHTLVYFGGNVSRIWLHDTETGEDTELYKRPPEARSSLNSPWGERP